MPGAVVHTDPWKGYAGLATAGYQHPVTVISGGSDPAHEAMPRVQVAQAFFAWIIGAILGAFRLPAPAEIAHPV